MIRSGWIWWFSPGALLASLRHFWPESGFKLVFSDGAEETLGAAEARLLLCFLGKPNRVLKREQLAGTSDMAPFYRGFTFMGGAPGKQSCNT